MQTFRTPRRYDPTYSPLGRAVRAWADDRLRAEALFIVLLTGLILLLLMTHYLGWALLKPVLTEDPVWQRAFWVGQVASVLALGGVGLVGFRPAVRTACTPEGLSLEQGSRSCTLPRDEVNTVRTIGAETYHRHYRRYAATRAFVSTLPDEVLLIECDEGPVVVALPDAGAREHVAHHLRRPAAESVAATASVAS